MYSDFFSQEFSRLSITFMNSCCSFQGSPSEEIHFKIESDEAHMEETSFSGQDISIEHSDILEWAKVVIQLSLVHFIYYNLSSI